MALQGARGEPQPEPQALPESAGVVVGVRGTYGFIKCAPACTRPTALHGNPLGPQAGEKSDINGALHVRRPSERKGHLFFHISDLSGTVIQQSTDEEDPDLSNVFERGDEVLFTPTESHPYTKRPAAMNVRKLARGEWFETREGCEGTVSQLEYGQNGRQIGGWITSETLGSVDFISVQMSQQCDQQLRNDNPVRFSAKVDRSSAKGVVLDIKPVNHQYYGVIHSLKDSYGFIRGVRDAKGKHFFHCTSLQCDWNDLHVGAEVRFEIAPDRRSGKTSAQRVALLPAGSVTEEDQQRQESEGEREKGVVVELRERYGFIRGYDREDPVLFPFSSVKFDVSSLERGMDVTFLVKMEESKLYAINVELDEKHCDGIGDSDRSQSTRLAICTRELPKQRQKNAASKSKSNLVVPNFGSFVTLDSSEECHFFKCHVVDKFPRSGEVLAARLADSSATGALRASEVRPLELSGTIAQHAMSTSSPGYIDADGIEELPCSTSILYYIHNVINLMKAMNNEGMRVKFNLIRSESGQFFATNVRNEGVEEHEEGNERMNSAIPCQAKGPDGTIGFALERQPVHAFCLPLGLRSQSACTEG